MVANVTDHAVLRWLERACDIDVETVRHLIGECCARGLEAKCKCIVIDGVKFIATEDGTIVTALHKRAKGGGFAKVQIGRRARDGRL